MRIKRKFEIIKEATFDFEIICHVCNSKLSSSIAYGDGNIIFIDPCERCMKEAISIMKEDDA